jgi:hypothetical protein
VVTLCLGRAIAESQVAMVARPAMELSDHVPDGRMATNSNHWAPKVDGTLSDPNWAVN